MTIELEKTKKYIVEYKETITHICEVEARDRDHAKEIAGQMYYDDGPKHNIYSTALNVESSEHWIVKEIKEKEVNLAEEE